MELDHLILPVNDLDATVRFFTEVLALDCEGESGPFTVIRVGPGLTLQLAPWGTTGGQPHRAAWAPSTGIRSTTSAT